ncbi:MAG: GC-type dockerin domain-anchored protein [Phycisphaerales bacterium]
MVSTFFGTLIMGENSVLNVATPWTLDDLAVFDVNAGSGTATIAGADFDLFSIFTNVNSGTLVLASASTYLWGGGPTAAQVTLAPSTALRIDGPANLGWSAGFHLGSGTLIINADTTIGAGTALSNFDWDGDGTATTIVDHGATLSIEVYELNLVNDTFSGTILVEDGTIDIALNDGEWELAGDLTFKCGSTPPTLRGAGLVVTGTVHNTGSGSSAIQNDIEIAPGGVVTNGPGAMPVFTGNLTLDGGSLAGMGSMTLGGPGADVTAPSLIDLDGDLLIDDATVLTIDAPLTLRCNDLTSATPGGGALAATVVVNAPGLLDYEHASPQASPFAGVLALNGDSPTVGAVLMTGDRVELAGTLNVENKVIIESPLDISGDVSLHGDGALVLRGGTTAAPTALTSTCRVIGYGSPSTLTIDGAAQIESGASFLARVVLEVGATGELRTGQIDVLPSSFRCDGRLSFGPASNPVVFYATDDVGFGSDSRLDIRLGASGNDSVAVAPSVLGGVTMVEILGGELNVELTDGYVPPFGPLFTVVTNTTTNGVRIGQFDTVTGPPNMSVIYTATAVYVTFADPACSPADLDANGTLNLDDVNLFANAFVVGDSLADLDGNGALNLDDVNTFASAFVAGCP